MRLSSFDNLWLYQIVMYIFVPILFLLGIYAIGLLVKFREKGIKKLRKLIKFRKRNF